MWVTPSKTGRRHTAARSPNDDGLVDLQMFQKDSSLINAELCRTRATECCREVSGTVGNDEAAIRSQQRLFEQERRIIAGSRSMKVKRRRTRTDIEVLNGSMGRLKVLLKSRAHTELHMVGQSAGHLRYPSYLTAGRK